MPITLEAIATVKNSRTVPTDDFWGDVLSEIILAPHIPTEVLNGISDFSHLEIIYHFHDVGDAATVYAGHPRGNPAYPSVGIFAQRKRDRPNLLGLCTVELVEHKDRSLFVKNLDAIDGSPVLDIKPVMREFGAAGSIRQPGWVAHLMEDYWKESSRPQSSSTDKP